MGRDYPSSFSFSFANVSIHAPAWGATLTGSAPGTMMTVSIHAPAWGATLVFSFTTWQLKGFNPRARMGRDRTDTARRCGNGRFNPRARMGRDRKGPHTDYARHVSIHAPAWGATKFINVGICMDRFQSTRPHGARHFWAYVVKLRFVVSIHAPAWGATPFWRRSRKHQQVSIHAPAWGATRADRSPLKRR